MSGPAKAIDLTLQSARRYESGTVGPREERSIDGTSTPTSQKGCALSWNDEIPSQGDLSDT